VPAPDFISRPPYNVYQPGAYSAVDASQLAGASTGQPQPVPAIIGVAFGGQPKQALYFRSPGQLRTVLKSGPAYDVARFAFDGGAQQLCVVRIGNSVSQATLALAGASGTVVTLTSLDWGSWCNSIQVSVATGPIITLVYTDQFGNTFTETWNLTGVAGLTVAQIAQAINGQLYGYNASNFVSAVAGAGTLPMTVVSNQPLTGGTDGTAPVAGDWTAGLQVLETEQIDIVVPAVGDSTVHAQVLTHCQNLSLPNARRERTAVVGGVLGETFAQAIARMTNLRSGRVQLAYPGLQDYNAAGALATYDPFYLAGKVAGMHCALPDPATSLLHKRVPIIGVEIQLSTIQGGAVDQLLQAGVTPVAPAPGGGYWIVDSLSGYNLPDQTFRDFHKTRSADFVAQYSRNQLETAFVGSKNLLGSQAAIQAKAVDVMSRLKRMQIIQQYKTAIVAQGPVPGSWTVQLPVMLIDANKFIFITVSLQPSATVSNSASLTAADALA
jgi:hypothetical protein